MGGLSTTRLMRPRIATMSGCYPSLPLRVLKTCRVHSLTHVRHVIPVFMSLVLPVATAPGSET